jgi:hypothetical protein
LPLKISGNVTIGGNYSSNATLTYFIFDKDNLQVTQGTGKWIDDNGNFLIAINASSTKAMSIGPNNFQLFVKSNYALRPDIYSGIFISVPNPVVKN